MSNKEIHWVIDEIVKGKAIPSNVPSLRINMKNKTVTFSKVAGPFIRFGRLDNELHFVFSPEPMLPNCLKLNTPVRPKRKNEDGELTGVFHTLRKEIFKFVTESGVQDKMNYALEKHPTEKEHYILKL